MTGVLLLVVATAASVPPPAVAANDRASTQPQPGLTAAEAVARAYDAILDADVDGLDAILAETCGPAPPVACAVLRPLGAWWDIQLDPENRRLDARFTAGIEAAIAGAEAWTSDEPDRAEAWLYLGVALGARAQWRVLRDERLSAARDGKRIRRVLERALALDPRMDDAAFGLGVYQYYAAVAPRYLRWLRWLLLLPGGDREEGLRLMERARDEGRLVASEAAYQLHLAYLWYEDRAPEALALVRGLAARYPHNPLFRDLEARILDVYVHDAAGSLASSEALLAAASAGDVRRAPLAAARARLNIARQHDHLGDRSRARAVLDALLADAAHAPIDVVRRARALRDAWTRR